MSWLRKTYRFRNETEIEEYHNGRYGAPGQERAGKGKPTPEQVEKVNRRNREKLSRRRMRMYFRERDLFVTLTYRVDARPADMETAKKHFQDFAKKAGRAYRKQGIPFRWIRNIENGTRNAWHVHLVMNRIPDIDLVVADAWPHGRVDLRPCSTEGDWSKLAAYLTKTPATEPRLREASWSSSRNMPLPEPEKRVVYRWETWGDVRIPKGFYLDKKSYHEGINPVTGYKYREYTLVRTIRKEEKHVGGKRIHRDKPTREGKGNRKGGVRHAGQEKGRKPAREKGSDGTGSGIRGKAGAVCAEGRAGEVPAGQ